MKYAVFRRYEFIGFADEISPKYWLDRDYVCYEINYKATFLRRIKFLFTGKL